jgi:hypothetical protein
MNNGPQLSFNEPAVLMGRKCFWLGVNQTIGEMDRSQ